MINRSGKSTSNPCDICAVNISDCPWLHEGKPVPGWDAEPVQIKLGWDRVKGVRVPVVRGTFKILDCPMFIKTERQCKYNAR
jgi:hypothetical protein